MSRKRVSGFTLLEMVLVVAIMGILATLSVASLSGMQPRMDVMGALDDLAATLAQAQVRAQSQGTDVWVIFVPTVADTGIRAQGGVVVYEDAHRNLDFANLAIEEDGGLTTASGDRVASERWYGQEPHGGRVQLHLEPGQGFALRAPFSGDAATCNFCSDAGNGPRGAVVFQANGEVRLLDGHGKPVSHLTAAVVTLSSQTARGALAIAPGTGFTRVIRP